MTVPVLVTVVMVMVMVVVVVVVTEGGAQRLERSPGRGGLLLLICAVREVPVVIAISDACMGELAASACMHVCLPGLTIDCTRRACA